MILTAEKARQMTEELSTVSIEVKQILSRIEKYIKKGHTHLECLDSLSPATEIELKSLGYQIYNNERINCLTGGFVVVPKVIRWE